MKIKDSTFSLRCCACPVASVIDWWVDLKKVFKFCDEKYFFFSCADLNTKVFLVLLRIKGMHLCIRIAKSFIKILDVGVLVFRIFDCKVKINQILRPLISNVLFGWGGGRGREGHCDVPRGNVLGSISAKRGAWVLLLLCICRWIRVLLPFIECMLVCYSHARRPAHSMQTKRISVHS